MKKKIYIAGKGNICSCENKGYSVSNFAYIGAVNVYKI